MIAAASHIRRGWDFAPSRAEGFDPDQGHPWPAVLEFRLVLGLSLQGICMSSFSCPHFDMERENCMRLQTDCVPGRPGWVLSKNSVFAVPIDERIRAKEEAKRRVQEKG